MTKFIGMDVHSASITVGWIDEDGFEIRPFTIPNTVQDLRSFCRAIDRPAKIAIEATRNHAFVHDLIEAEGLEVLVSHPKHTEAIASCKKKSDRHDARTLARLLRADLLTESYVPPLEIRLLRELVREYIRLTRVSTRARNWIRAILASEGMTCRFSDIFGKGAREWLACAQMHPDRKRSIERSLALISALSLNLRAVTAEIVARVKGDPDVELLISIPGIGYILGAIIIAEIGDISRFPSGRKLAGYTGLVTTTRESAGIVRHGHITKEGSANLRWALCMATSHLLRKPGPMKSFYNRLLERHGKKSARVACARKLTNYIFAILASRERYDPGTAAKRRLQHRLGQPPVCVG